MKIEKFITDIAEALEIETTQLAAETEYKELASWDSLAALSVIAMIDENYNVSIGGDDIEKSRTVQELWDLVSQRMA
ncbi:MULTISPECIES: acyl carrier protein [unclassified Massilia]|uniref:acyl carrier protein n=1 Tax=unclassified Massilia TaxID=2609279 RepID=UPI00177FDC91|nr:MULTISPECIES: acyl carrier protein [unclassified Massilia]MBD8528760.1 acyl carrier protein [Massilia sp. CFBP 13647]MBD8673401.1 acyl carrier protein [Massilia sp. CFBP 13721]